MKAATHGKRIPIRWTTVARAEPHNDGGVWVILGLLFVVSITAVYLFWAKLAAAWPFGF